MSDIKNLLDIVEEFSEEEGLVESQDSFDFELGEDLLIETGVVDINEDGILVEADEETIALLEQHGITFEDTDWTKYDEPTISRIKKGTAQPADRTNYDIPPAMRDKDIGKPGYAKRRSRIMKGLVGEGLETTELGQAVIKMLGSEGRKYRLDQIERAVDTVVDQEGFDVDPRDQRAVANIASKVQGLLRSVTTPTIHEDEIDEMDSEGYKGHRGDEDPGKGPEKYVKAAKVKDVEQAALKDLDKALDREYKSDDLDEAEYHGRKVPLGKPMAGDVKKSKVYVRKPNGKVVKVNFGDKKMRIKKSNPKRRKSFRARHNCKNPGPRWKARYWSCRAW